LQAKQTLEAELNVNAPAISVPFAAAYIPNIRQLDRAA
jgi:hypothetical protein